MVKFTFAEYADMLLVLGECHGNSEMATRRYAQKYPRRVVPNRRTFVSTYRRIRETGTVLPAVHFCGNKRRIRTLRNEENVLNLVENNSRISTRRISLQTGISHATSWRILKEQQLYPFHMQRVQDLLETDYQTRLDFCQWLLRKIRCNNEFIKNVLFTDEATFTRSGIFNMHNEHEWSEENPHSSKVTNFQHKFKVNVWAGVIHNQVIGPFILHENLNGNRYTAFLRENLIDLLEDVPYQQRINMWYMHDGAPPHFAVTARDWLNNHFTGRWIGRGVDAPVKWPQRSPDLNPMDYGIWGIIKEKVYSEPIDTVEELIGRIQYAFRVLANSRFIVQKTTNQIKIRARKCIEVGGRLFEPFLK